MINKKTNKVIDKLAKGSKAHEEMLSKRAILSVPNYINLSKDLLAWSLRCAIKNPKEQIAFLSNCNRDKVKYILTFLQTTEDEFKDIGGLKNLHFFNQYLDLTSNESTEHVVKTIKKRLNKNRKLSVNGGVIVIDNFDEVVFPLNPHRVPSNTRVMHNLDKLITWHKYRGYSVVFGTVTTPIPNELKKIFGGHWEYQSFINEGNHDNGNNKNH